MRMGFIGSLPGKTPEATMASALYTDIKRWKAGIPGSVFCRCVARLAAGVRARAPPPLCPTTHVDPRAAFVVRAGEPRVRRSEVRSGSIPRVSDGRSRSLAKSKTSPMDGKPAHDRGPVRVFSFSPSFEFDRPSSAAKPSRPSRPSAQAALSVPFTPPHRARPKEGLFGLREWASDPELAPLVASERAFEDAPRAARDGDRSGGVSKLRGSSWSDGSDASARSDALVRDASADASCAGRPAKRRGKKSAGPAASSGKEEGLRLLLDAATGAGGVDDAEERCEAAAAAAAKDEPSSRTESPNDPFRVGSDASLDRARAPSAEGVRVDEREAPTRAGAGAGARGDASALASAPPSASDAAAAEARRQSLDGVVAALSARCAELYVLLGPHELVVRDLAELVLALRIGGARYALQEKTVTEMLWELARAVAFPGGFGETAEMLAVLARIVAGIIDNAAVRATASIAEAEAASARREREALARAALSAAGASARGADAGDEAAASKLLASLQNSLDRGASASASAYAALAAASGGTGVARTTPPTPRAE